MDDHSREMLIQLLLRNIRQMYYSRAYCEPRLQRFMIRAPPPEPSPPAPSKPQPPPKSDPEEETVAADVKAEVDGVRKDLC